MAKITIRSDHLPLKRFLEKSTLNSKVNNWAVELEDQNISFEYIPGISSVLAGALSRLIEIDSTVQLKPEEIGKEFGNVPFQELPTVQTSVLEECLESEEDDTSIKSGLKIKNNTPVQKDLPVEIPVTRQEKEDRINNMRKIWASNKLCKKSFLMEKKG